MEPDQAPPANPYDDLHLLSSAPLELVSEVYWHLAAAARRSAATDPVAVSHVQRLNAAYRAIMANATARDAQEAEPPPAAPPRKRRPKGRAEQPPPVDPCDLLHVQRGAPPDVIDVAHRYGLERTRDSDHEPEDIEALERARDALLGAPARDDDATARSVGSVQERAAARSNVRPEQQREDGQEAPPGRSSATRSLAAGAGTAAVGAGRRLAGFAKPRMARARVMLQRRLTDPFNEYERRRAEIMAEELAAQEAEKRLAGLTKERVSRDERSMGHQEDAAARVGDPRDEVEELDPGALAALIWEPRIGVQRSVPIDEDGLAIGGGPGCALGAGAHGDGAGVDARITVWREQFLLQVLAPERRILLNGRPVVSAVLTDGDVVQLANRTYRFVLRQAVAIARRSTAAPVPGEERPHT